jgi:predicted alpha/beta hydrolase family esterase
VKRYNRKIKAALLVAPPDTDIINQNVQEKLFEETPTQRIPFPTTLVASTNDPWASIEKAEFYAQQWGSEFINIGAAGHINAQSGLGEWKQGLEILSKLG